MKKLIFLLALLFSLFSCSLDLESETPYYKFSKSDYKYIPTVYDEVGKIFTFRNQLNEEIKLEVLDYYFTKETGGGIGSSESFHYYQLLTIELKVVDNNISNSNCDLKKIRISNWGGHYIATRFNFNNAPDPCTNGSSVEKLEFPYRFNEMRINNVNYNKVVNIFEGSGIYFHPDYSFNKVYFDFKEGIIGFDDLENNKWRIVN